MNEFIKKIYIVFFPKSLYERYIHMEHSGYFNSVDGSIHIPKVWPMTLHIDKNARPWWCFLTLLRFTYVFKDNNKLISNLYQYINRRRRISYKSDFTNKDEHLKNMALEISNKPLNTRAFQRFTS